MKGVGLQGEGCCRMGMQVDEPKPVNRVWVWVGKEKYSDEA